MYIFLEFSLTSWRISNHVDAKHIDALERSLLYRDLDIGWYFSMKCEHDEKLSFESNTSGKY